MKTKSLKNKEKTVLIIGDLVQEHDIASLVTVFHTVCQTEEVSFVIAGLDMNMNSWSEAVAESGLADNVSFIEVDNAAVLANAYQECDLFIDPTEAEVNDFEAHEVAILEAMRFKKPVVTTTQMEVAKVVEGGKNAITVSGHNLNELCATIIRLVRNERMTEELAKRGSLHVVSGFDFSTLSEAACVAYDKVTQFVNLKVA